MEIFFLLLPGTGGGSYTGNFFSFCCQGLYLGYGFQDLDGRTDRQTDIVTLIYKIKVFIKKSGF